MKQFLSIILVTCCIAMIGCKTDSNSNQSDKGVELQKSITTKETEQPKSTPKQYKKHSITEKINGKTHTHSFVVNDGKVTWSYSGSDGKESQTYDCNPDVPAQIIINEVEAMAYWSLASECFNEMTDIVGMYSYDLHQKGKRMLSKCATSLSKVKKYCPGAYKKAQNHYKNLIDAEGSGADELWEEICLLAYGLEENPLDVCDVYFD